MRQEQQTMSMKERDSENGKEFEVTKPEVTQTNDNEWQDKINVPNDRLKEHKRGEKHDQDR